MNEPKLHKISQIFKRKKASYLRTYIVKEFNVIYIK